MSKFNKVMKRALTSAVTFTTILWSVGVAGMPLAAQAQIPQAPALIKGSLSSVYYLGTDGKRYVFPNETTFFTWYENFDSVVTITDAELASLPIGGNVTFREGSWMGKITTDPKTYWVGRGGSLHHVQSEANAQTIAGADWNTKVRDIPDAFFVNYNIGAPLAGNLTADGMLFRTTAGGQVWLVDDGKARKVTAAGMTANRFQEKFVWLRTDLAVAAAAQHELQQGPDVTTNDIWLKSNPATASGAAAQPPAPVAAGDLTVTQQTLTGRTIVSDGVNNIAPAEIFEAMRLRFEGTGKVTKLVFKRKGVSADQDTDSGVLYKTGDTSLAGKLAENRSFASGVMTFENSAGLFDVNGSYDMSLWVHQNNNTNAGITLGFDLTGVGSSAGNVGTAAVTAALPLSGPLFSVANVGDLADLRAALVATSATVDSREPNFDAMRLNLTSNNQDTRLTSMSYRFIGSSPRDQIKNIRLLKAGTQVGQAAGLDAAGRVTFKFGTEAASEHAMGLELKSGVLTQFILRIEVGDAANFSIQFQVERDSIVAYDANYGVRVRAETSGANAFTFATINSTLANVNVGNATLSLSPVSPSATVVLNGTNITKAIFEAEAVGENIKLNSLTIGVDLDDNNDLAATNIRNVRILIGEKGLVPIQVGTTQALVADCSVDGNAGCEVSTVLVTLNFIFEVGKKYEIHMVQDILSGAGVGQALANTDIITDIVVAGANNAELLQSGGTINFPGAAVNGNPVTVGAATLPAAQDASLGVVTVVQNTTQAPLARFTMSPTGEDQEIFTWTITDRNNAGNANGAQSIGSTFTNLKFFLLGGGTVGGVQVTAVDEMQLGTAIVTNAADAAGTTYTFTASTPVRVNNGGTSSFEVRADARSNANATWTDGDRTRLTASSSTGVSTGQTVNLAAAANLQVVNVAAGPAITLTNDGSTPTSKQVSLGSTENELAIWRLQETTGNEDAILDQVIVNQTVGGGNGTVKNLKLWVPSGTAAAGVGAAITWTQVSATVASLDGNGNARFKMTSPIKPIVPRNGEVKLRLTADSSDFSALQVSGQTSQFRIAVPAAMTGADAETLTVRGKSGNFATTPGAANVNANTHIFLRSVLKVTLAQSGGSTGARSASEKVGTSTFDVGSTAVLRGAGVVPDDNVANWGQVGGAIVVNAGGNASVDGGNNIRFTENAASAVNDHFDVDLGAAALADDYNGGTLDFWIRSSAAKAAGDIQVLVSDDRDITDNGALNLTNPIAAINVPVLAANAWTFVSLGLAAIPATGRFITFNIAANVDNNATIDVDDVRLHHDFVQLTVIGNLLAAAGRLNAGFADGARFELRDASGVTKADGYFNANGSVTQGVARMTVGQDNAGAAFVQRADETFSGPVTWELFVNSQGLMLADTQANENATYRLLAGNPLNGAPTGDVRWFDQTNTNTGLNPPAEQTFTKVY